MQLEALGDERDFSRFPPSRAAERLLAVQEWLELPEVEVRRFTTQFLHGKAYLFGDEGDPRVALVTSANLTGAGLFRNLELGLAHYQPNVTRQAIEWFDYLWASAAPFDDELRDASLPRSRPDRPPRRLPAGAARAAPAATRRARPCQPPDRARACALPARRLRARPRDRPRPRRRHLRRRGRHRQDRDRPRLHRGAHQGGVESSRWSSPRRSSRGAGRNASIRPSCPPR